MTDTPLADNAQVKRSIMATPEQIEILEKLNQAANRGRVVVISENEWKLICASRKIDFFRAGKPRTIVLEWNGGKLKPLDTMQIG